MLVEVMDASAAAYHVGYVSRSAVSLEPRHFGMWNRSSSNLSEQNCKGGYGNLCVEFMRQTGLELFESTNPA